MISTRQRHDTSGSDIWPGFVDALSSLLMVIIFLLLVFVLAQFYLSEVLSARDDQLARLNRQLAELSETLALERQSNAGLRTTVSQLSLELQTTTTARNDLTEQLANMTAQAELARTAAEFLRGELSAAVRQIELGKEASGQQLADADRLREQIAALQRARDLLEADLVVARKTVDADRH